MIPAFIRLDKKGLQQLMCRFPNNNKPEEPKSINDVIMWSHPRADTDIGQSFVTDGTQLLINLRTIINVKKLGTIKDAEKENATNRQNDQKMSDWKATKKGKRPTHKAYNPKYNQLNEFGQEWIFSS